MAAEQFDNDWDRVSSMFECKSAQACEQRFKQMSPDATNSASKAAASDPAAAAASSAPSSIIPSSGLSHTAKLLFVTSKLYTRNLLSREEKRILKQLAIRGDAGLYAIDLSSEQFLTQLIDTASAIAITNASHTFHNWLYQQCTTNHGKTLSKSERKAKNISDNSFVYGEIDFHSFATIIKEIRPLFPAGGTFVDLGSGTGRPCFAMALLSDMRRIVGIEFLEDLVHASEQIREKYETFIADEDDADADEEEGREEGEEEEEEGEPKQRPTAADGSPLRVRRNPSVSQSPLARLERNAALSPSDKRVQFIRGDFLSHDWWSDSDLVFLNSTCYSPALIASISAHAEKLKSGSIVVSLTKALTSPQFTLLSKKKYQMRYCTHTAALHTTQQLAQRALARVLTSSLCCLRAAFVVLCVSWGAATAYVQKRL